MNEQEQIPTVRLAKSQYLWTKADLKFEDVYIYMRRRITREDDHLFHIKRNVVATIRLMKNNTYDGLFFGLNPDSQGQKIPIGRGTLEEVKNRVKEYCQQHIEDL